MPPVPGPAEQSSAFTILHHREQRSEAARPLLPRSVNVVKPLQHEEVPPTLVLAPPNTILDPKFSRALDFKLRRLKDKEILQANLRRPTRPRPYLAGAASNPNICNSQPSWPVRRVSRSHPRIDAIPPDEDCSSKMSFKMESSPIPGAGTGPERRSRLREPDKPRFVTTVKSGQFLPPPPELACLLGLQTMYPQAARERIVYEYASKPKVVPMQKEQSCAPHAAKRAHVGAVFSGIRALLAGVVGVHAPSDTWVHI